MFIGFRECEAWTDIKEDMTLEAIRAWVKDFLRLQCLDRHMKSHGYPCRIHGPSTRRDQQSAHGQDCSEPPLRRQQQAWRGPSFRQTLNAAGDARTPMATRVCPGGRPEAGCRQKRTKGRRTCAAKTGGTLVGTTSQYSMNS